MARGIVNVPASCFQMSIHSTLYHLFSPPFLPLSLLPLFSPPPFLSLPLSLPSFLLFLLPLLFPPPSPILPPPGAYFHLSDSSDSSIEYNCKLSPNHRQILISNDHSHINMKQILEVETRTGDSTGIIISNVLCCKMD